jgi:hypothetical protein
MCLLSGTHCLALIVHLAAQVAKFFAVLLTYPAQTVKLRMQAGLKASQVFIPPPSTHPFPPLSTPNQTLPRP